MQKHHLHILSLILVFTLFMAACGSRKNTTQTAVQRQSPADSMFQVLNQNEFQFEWLKASFKADTKTSSGNLSFSGQIRMRRDSVIWISLSPALGIEVARLKITPDSVLMINKLKKTYLRAPVSYINNFLDTDLDFDMVQSLLLGNDFTYYSQEQFQVRETETSFVLHTVNRRKLKEFIDTANVENLLIQKMTLSKANYKIVAQDIKQVRNPNKKLNVDYSEFEMQNEQLLPTNCSFVIKGMENISLQLEFSKYTFDETLSFPFKITSKYKRI